MRGHVIPIAVADKAYQQNVVVDGLGHANDAAHNAIRSTLLLDGIGAGVATVATHHKQNVDAPHIDALDNLPMRLMLVKHRCFHPLRRT